MIDTGEAEGTMPSFETSVVKKGKPESILASSIYQRLAGSIRGLSTLTGPRARSLVDLSTVKISDSILISGGFTSPHREHNKRVLPGNSSSIELVDAPKGMAELLDECHFAIRGERFKVSV